jgi:hypothetical protein
MRKVLIAGLAAVAFGAAGLLPTPAAAQWPPEGATYDPSDVRRAIRTTPRETGGNVITTYVYDCKKKKWTIVSEIATLSTYFPGVTPSSGQVEIKQNIGKTALAGPPLGAKQEIGDPDRASNPTTGQNFVRDKGNWVDVKTDQVIVAPKLCPETETAVATPPTEKTTGGKHGTSTSKYKVRKKDDTKQETMEDSPPEISIGIGIGGGREREHKRDRKKGEHRRDDGGGGGFGISPGITFGR